MSQIIGKTTSGQAVKISIENEKIVAIENIDSNENLPYISAGLCDLQMNGYAGVDFNSKDDLSSDDLSTFATACFKEGTTTFLPTIITNDVDAISDRLANICKSMKSIDMLEHSLLGFHIEGPFISPLDGARGAHDKAFICEPNIKAIKKWQEITNGMIKIITLSPEWQNANEVIKEIASMGICVSIGHSMATEEQISQAALAGASMVTHFGNGVPVQIPRHPNFLWQQMAEDSLSLGIIADGFHLPDSVLKVVLKLKKENCFLVSDSTAFGGKEPGVYEAHIGGKVVLSEDGRLSLFENQNLLAGSAKSLKHCVENLIKKDIASMEHSFKLATTIPAKKINMEQHSSLQVGSYANIVLFDYSDSKISILESYIHGKKY